MAGMDKLRRPQLLMGGAVLLVVFAGAVSMHMEWLRGWGFLILCFLAGSLGGLGFVWARKQLQSRWNRLDKRWKALLVGTVVAAVLLATFIANYGRRDAVANDLLTVGGITVALITWGLYHLFSRFIDALWARFTNR